MECNKDEALRAKEIAVKKFEAKDVVGARKFALKAQNLFPALEGINQMIATLDVYLASEIKVQGEKDWYAILCVNASVDEETLKKQYRRLALQLHPDKNKSIGAEGAFQLISEAWSVLSDKSKRMKYDQKRNVRSFMQKPSQPNKASVSTSNGFYNFTNNAAAKAQTAKTSASAPPATSYTSSQPTKPKTFWTSCNACKMQYEYLRLYLNHKLLCPSCHEPFLAMESEAPTDRLRSSVPWSASQKGHASTNQNITGENASFPGGNNSTLPETGASGHPDQNFQWGPFSRTTGAASATASSAAAAQAANVVHQTYEKVRREREEAQAAARREALLRKKNNALKRNASDAGIASVGPRDGLNSKNGRCIGDSGNDKGGVSTEQFVASEKEKSSGVFVDFYRSRMSGRQSNLGKEFCQMDIRRMLIDMTKSSVAKKLEEWKSAESAKVEAKENAKKKQKLDDSDKKKIKNVVHVDTTNLDRSDDLRTDAEECAAKKNSPENQTANSDEEIIESVSMDVPDPDFHDFDKDRTERSFGNEQIWATYDEEDGMPRYYVLVQKVISLNPFKVRMSFLTSKSNSEFGPLDWVATGFTKTSGDFRISRYEVMDAINIFSHKVRWEKGPRGVIKIFPGKGEVWAIYRNWSADWNEHTPDDIIYKYDMVEVLEDYSEEQGISVSPLVKVAGFKAVFRRLLDPKEVRRIQKKEMFRFSHQVPSYILTGEEAENAPKGCYELDPAATPLELLQVIKETQPDTEKEAVDQPINQGN